MALNANHLLTLAEAREWLGIPVSTVQVSIDGIIETCINAASAQIESYLDRKLILASVTKRYDGNARPSLELGEWPVRSVASVYESAAWTFDSTTLIDPSYYRVNDNGISIDFKERILRVGSQNVQVSFQYGYDSPTTPTSFPLQPVMKQCAYMLTEWFYNERNDRRIGISSKAKGAETISFIDGLPSTIASMLEPFRRDFFIPDTRAVHLR